jgi:ACS family hexuronate transporter-like MFS transporter
VPWITLNFGWRAAFGVTGALGLIWLVPWLLIYRPPEEHPNVSKAELNAIQADPGDPPANIPWLSLLRHKSTWAFVIATLLTSPVWWFYLFWVPDFLFTNFHFDLKNIGLPLILVYLIADVGSIGGGWLSSSLIAHGRSLNFARKTALFTCAACVIPVVAASQIANPWVATILIGLAAAGHQGWSANLYTLVSDTTPRKAVSSVVGMGGMAGAIGGMYMAKFVGGVLQLTHSYVLLFTIAPCAYLLAFAVIQILVPTIKTWASEDAPT